MSRHTRKALVTIIDGEYHKQFAKITMPTFERYADRYGYDIVISDPSADVPTAQWSKPIVLREALDDYEVAVWVDIDAAISTSAPDIAGYFAESLVFQALSWLNYEPRGVVEDHAALTGQKPSIIDTGVWAVQQHPTAVRFLEEMVEQRDLYERQYGRLDTSAVWRLLGGFDVDRVEAVRRGWWRYAAETLLLRETWNARLHWFARHPQAVPFVFHACSHEETITPENVEERLDLLRTFVGDCC